MAKMDLPPDFVFETEANNPNASHTTTIARAHSTPNPHNNKSALYYARKHTHDDYSTSDESEHTSDESPDDAARTGKSLEERSHALKRKHHKVVTFENNEHLKQIGDDDDQDEDEETEEQKYMRLRYKRSGSLPSIELNRELARKIRRMLKEEDNNSDEILNRQLSEGLKLSQEVDKTTSEVRYEYEFAHGQVLQARLGDITEEMVDVIVNEANSNLTHNGGIAGVIAQKGGREIQHLSDRWIRKHGPVPPGHVAVTEAGQLPCRWLINAVGPIWRGGNSGEDTELFDAMWSSFVWASKLQAKSVAIPLIGAGFLGFQKERCAYLLVDCVAKFFRKHPTSSVREIRVVNHNEPLSESVIFEMVGKFTSGCETSESEREFDEEEDEDEEDEFDEEEEEVDHQQEAAGDTQREDGNGTETASSPPTTLLPPRAHLAVTKSPKSVIKEYVDPSWMPVWRRQSIA